MQPKSVSLDGRKVYVAIPAYDYKIAVKSAIALSQLPHVAAPLGVSIGINHVSGCSIVAVARNMLVDQFLANDFSHLLFLDSDIVFEPKDVIRMLALSGDDKIIGGVPRTRSNENRYLVRFAQEAISPTELGTIRAMRLSTSFLMIPRKVFTTLRDAHPEWAYVDKATGKGYHAFFDFKITPEGYMGEDFLFCDRAAEHGFEIWADPTIKLGHMGMVEFEGNFLQHLVDSVDQTALNSAA